VAKYGHQINFPFGNPDDFCLAGRQQGYGAREILHFSDNLTKKRIQKKVFCSKRNVQLKERTGAKTSTINRKKEFQNIQF
jgi:hypothetical protein